MHSAFGILHSAFCILALAGCSPVAMAQPKAGGPATQGAPEVVMAGNPVRKNLTFSTTQPARIEPLEQTPIYSKLAAYVGEVPVDFGDAVKKDQPLVRLVAPELDADVAQKAALLEQAQAQAVQAEAGAKAAEAAVVTAQSKRVQAAAATDRAQADIVRWRAEFSRVGQLATSGSVTRQLVDETQQKLSAAEAALKEAAAAIDAAQALVGQAQAEAAKAAADVTAAQAQVRVAEANLTRSQADHAYLTIKAPFAGVITHRRVDPGHFVQPAGASAAPLLTVARTDKLRVFVAVTEQEAAYVDVGDAALVEVQSLRGAQVAGRVSRTSVALDATNRSLDTIIDIDNAQGRLRPGLFATARITLQEQPGALALPAAAVVRQGREAFCYRLIGGKATKTPLELGIKAGDDWEIAGGLKETDMVILNKAGSLKDGQAVDVLKAEVKK